MTSLDVVRVLNNKFRNFDSAAVIPLLKGGSFKAKLVTGGIEVDNLGSQAFLPWSVFEEAVWILARNGGRAKRGDAMQSRLGDPELALDSVEDHVAHVIYGKRIGETIFRRITPIACILIWARICRPEPRILVLDDID